MKKLLVPLLLILSFLPLQSPAQKRAALPKVAAKPIVKAQVQYEIPIVTKTLANGLEVIVLADSSIPLVTVELAVRNGSFTEPPEFNGLSHLFEHMFFKANLAVRLMQCENAPPANRFSSNYLARCSEALKLKPQIGDLAYLKDSGQLGFANGTTREEVVNYFYTVTSPYLAAAIKQINDSVRYPAFDETDFANEKQVVIAELDRHEANPYQYLDLTMREKLFYKYPTRKTPGGTRTTVAAATTEQMRLIQSRYYVPNNAALVVTGDVKPEEVFRLAEQSLGNWERRKVDPFKEFPLVEHPPLTKSEGIFLEKTAEQSQQDSGENAIIMIGWQGPSIGKDDAATYAADVFSYIITQPDSRFQRNLVDSGLAASVNFGYYTQRNVGPINLFMVTTPDKAKAALKAAYAEVAAFTDPAYFTDEELTSAKTILESNDLFDREKLSEYSHTLGFWWSSTGIDYFRGYHRNLRASSRADINKYLQTYVQGKPRVALALLTPSAKQQANLTEQDLTGGK
ncbi:MAG: M16 family metallopeptidase [Pyrinomonadaceae bacterium]